MQIDHERNIFTTFSRVFLLSQNGSESSIMFLLHKLFSVIGMLARDLFFFLPFFLLKGEVS